MRVEQFDALSHNWVGQGVKKAPECGACATADRFDAIYSYRSATIGSSVAALRAGQTPKMRPTAAENANARKIAGSEIFTFQANAEFTAVAPPLPTTMPINPPRQQSTSASMRNWRRIA